MLEGYGPVTQALLGTLFTWGMTAVGAGLVYVIRGTQRKLLDVSLGFAAGVMTAASYWSLLEPAIQHATDSKTYGENGEYAFIPVAVGFLLGAVFVYGTDVFLEYLGINSPNMMLAMTKTKEPKDKIDNELERIPSQRSSNPSSVVIMEGPTTISTEFSDCISSQHSGSAQRRKTHSSSRGSVQTFEDNGGAAAALRAAELRASQWKRIMLLVVAITVHNIPEGLAVGVGFGAAASSASSFENARNLAIGIGIQNFPEGLAVSLPLHAAGFSVFRSFWYGQLSGMVEPVFGVLGAVAVTAALPVLPYALAFAAGAMIYVVADDILPEANAGGNGQLATWGCIVGFLVMMCLDVGLG